MGVLDRFERKLEAAVGAAFARVFGGNVVPQEVEQSLQRSATDGVKRLDGGYLLAPNSFTVQIGDSDHERLTQDEVLTTRAFARHLAQFIQESGWQTYGPVTVDLERLSTLHTGEFRTLSAVNPDAGAQVTPAPAPRQAPPPPDPRRGAEPMSPHHPGGPAPASGAQAGQPQYFHAEQGESAYGGGYGQPGYQGGQYGAGQYGGAVQYGQYGGGLRGHALTASLELSDGSGRNFTLREGNNVIGRGQEAQFRVPDTGVSRRHAEIRWDGQLALLADLESTNGTTVNGSPVTVWQLADGDVIRIGHSEIMVRIR